jgi:hypothetical protein
MMNKTDKIISLRIQVDMLNTVIANMREDDAMVEDSLRTCKHMYTQQSESIAYKTKLITDLTNEIKTGRKIIVSLKQHIDSLPVLAKPKMYTYKVDIQTTIPDLDDMYEELKLSLDSVSTEADIDILGVWEVERSRKIN